MRVPELVRDFFDWRWAPCVGLTAGSLAFVALALLLIPTRFGAEPRPDAMLSSFPSPRPQRTRYTSSLSANLGEPEQLQDESRVARAAPVSGPKGNEPRAPLQRGFSPILDRPEPPPAPPAPAAIATAAPAPPPVAEAPATAPGSAVVNPPAPGGEPREVTRQ